MGHSRSHVPVLHFVAAFSQYDAGLAAAKAWVTSSWGPVALESPTFAFVETPYYQRTMGSDLRKVFFAMETLQSPEVLIVRKLASNQFESDLASSQRFSCQRPVNLDPGYVTESKLVLASTKDHAHRLYLGEGIFAEITLQYRKGTWCNCEWTYPDYRREDYQAFFTECRDFYRWKLARWRSGEAPQA